MYRLTATLAVAISLLAAFTANSTAATLAAGSSGDVNGPSAILVLVPQSPSDEVGFDDQINDGFAAMPDLSVGMTSSTQGSYEASQALLDMSQGTRVSRSTYNPKDTPPVRIRPDLAGGGALISGWTAINERAGTAPQTIVPGLLASSIPGGAGFAGPKVFRDNAAIPAADEDGHISAASLSDTGSVAARAEKLARRQSFVVVKTAPGKAGLAQLGALLALRPDGQIVIATEAPPESINIPLLPIGIAGLGDKPSGLTSPTTNLPDIVAGIDIGPTVLDHLGISIPEDMRGRPIEASGNRDPGALVPFRNRLASLGSRRVPALAMVFAGWLAIFLITGAIIGRDRAKGPVRRLGGLAILWIPTTILIPAAIGNPPAYAEYLLIAGSALLLGWLSDRLLPWPKAPMIPAIVGLSILTVDLALGSHLIIRSVLGPNPGYGSRFYGVGNELKSGLTVIMLAGVAAYLTGRPKSRRSALTILGGGLFLGIVLGSGRLGAGVGAVIIVASATAVAALMMLPGGFTRKRVAILIAAPVIGLVILAVLDLLFAGGHGHYTHNVLDLTSWTTAKDVVTRRETLAFQQLRNGDMPVLVILCLSAAWYTIKNRDMFRPWAGPVWPAVLAGGLAGGLIGSVSEDSGPLLVVVATITLTGVCSYLLGRPDGTPQPEVEATTAGTPSSTPDR